MVRYRVPLYNPVSIHAPAGGATSQSSRKTLLIFVSIHAPAGGATVILVSSISIRLSFNPRTRRGCDGEPFVISSIGTPFQSTHPQGVRLAAAVVAPLKLPFQSTHPQGVRLQQLCNGAIYDEFQSTHPQGVRRHGQRLKRPHRSGFNPRTRRGCDARQ